MHDLNTINRINYEAFAADIIKQRAAGKHVVARYEGSRLVEFSTFDTRAEAERVIAEKDTPESRNAGTKHQLFAATVAATPAPAPTYNDATELALGKAYRTIAIDRPWLARDDFEAAYRAGLAATPAPAPQWVPVSERLPEPDSGEVLVWLTGGRCAFDEWHTHREDPIGMSTTHVLDMGCMWRDYEFEEVTHWMPIPAAPEAGLK